MPSASSEPSIITEVKPERMARHADGRALAVILVHDDGNVRVGFERGQDLVAQEGFAGIFAGAGRGLHDDRRVESGWLLRMMAQTCSMLLTLKAGRP